MFSYLNCNELYLPVSTFLSIYQPTYPRGWALGSLLPHTDKITRSYSMTVAGRFPYKIVLIQVNLLVNMIFLENYLIKVVMQIT